ncbi:glutaredoxin family protein [Metabacillus fastidiosus]|uniref:glutaredoxin family protein n=1 Tax=Metabacillus fastidiosus TaxID=1458 RepID=UPI002DB56253|nr:glutaredoxin family protein [Metabacillus fastidiosus]MEC2077233.1 glutaredoxin family protein [Metabacillus fastidiosus]MED4534017.1 glutaredoxin family protein [Metabacillus fastidiosus]
MSIKVKFFSKENCPLCDDGLNVIKSLQREIPFEIEVFDIYKDDKLLELYQIMIPVVTVNEEVISYGILDEDEIKKQIIENCQENNS